MIELLIVGTLVPSDPSSSGVPAGNTTALQYALNGKVLTVWFDFDLIAVNTESMYLQLVLPEASVASTACFTGQFRYSENGGPSEVGSASVVGTTLRFSKKDGAKWAVHEAMDPGLTSLNGGRLFRSIS